MIHSGVPLGVLPAGTANVLAVETGIPRSLKRAASTISTAVAEPVSAGLLKNEANPDGRYFLLMAGAGLDAHIVHHLDPQWKHYLGKLSYWVSGFAQLARRLPEFVVEAGPVSGRFSFALLSRVRNYGGDIEIARNVSLLDDQFEAVLFRGPNPFTYLRYFLAILIGRQARARGITICHSTQARIEAPASGKAYVQLDGEAAGELPATFELVPAAITLLLPPAYLARARRQAAASWTTSPTR
jgi:diacylglycerol kinase (ATP)